MMPQPAPLLTLDRDPVVLPADRAIGHLEREPAGVRGAHHEDATDRSAKHEHARVVEADRRGAHGVVDAPVGPGQPVELPPHASVRRLERDEPAVGRAHEIAATEARHRDELARGRDRVGERGGGEGERERDRARRHDAAHVSDLLRSPAIHAERGPPGRATATKSRRPANNPVTRRQGRRGLAAEAPGHRQRYGGERDLHGIARDEREHPERNARSGPTKRASHATPKTKMTRSARAIATIVVSTRRSKPRPASAPTTAAAATKPTR